VDSLKSSFEEKDIKSLLNTLIEGQWIKNIYEDLFPSVSYNQSLSIAATTTTQKDRVGSIV
jgi:hypothetical protein